MLSDPSATIWPRGGALVVAVGTERGDEVWLQGDTGDWTRPDFDLEDAQLFPLEEGWVAVGMSSRLAYHSADLSSWEPIDITPAHIGSGAGSFGGGGTAGWTSNGRSLLTYAFDDAGFADIWVLTPKP